MLNSEKNKFNMDLSINTKEFKGHNLDNKNFDFNNFKKEKIMNENKKYKINKNKLIKNNSNNKTINLSDNNKLIEIKDNNNFKIIQDFNDNLSKDEKIRWALHILEHYNKSSNLCIKHQKKDIVITLNNKYVQSLVQHIKKDIFSGQLPDIYLGTLKKLYYNNYTYTNWKLCNICNTEHIINNPIHCYHETYDKIVQCSTCHKMVLVCNKCKYKVHKCSICHRNACEQCILPVLIYTEDDKICKNCGSLVIKKYFSEYIENLSKNKYSSRSI